MPLERIVKMAIPCASRLNCDAIPSQRSKRAVSQCFFAEKKGSLHRGCVSVTHIPCGGRTGESSGSRPLELNRRLRCPRASKHSLHLASLQSSQLAAASKKKKLLLLSRLPPSLLPTNSKISAGRAVPAAPQSIVASFTFGGATC